MHVHTIYTPSHWLLVSCNCRQNYSIQGPFAAKITHYDVSDAHKMLQTFLESDDILEKISLLVQNVLIGLNVICIYCNTNIALYLFNSALKMFGADCGVCTCVK
jgi:hypothetical protein